MVYGTDTSGALSTFVLNGDISLMLSDESNCIKFATLIIPLLQMCSL